jgi:hypothetical protein
VNIAFGFSEEKLSFSSVTPGSGALFSVWFLDFYPSPLLLFPRRNTRWGSYHTLLWLS